jgi:hypothetical protein
LTDRAGDLKGSTNTSGVALIVQTSAVATLEVEEADRREVGAAALDAEGTVAALAVVDAPTLAIRARTLVWNADATVVAGQSRAIDHTVFGIGACTGVDAETSRAAIGNVAVPLVTFLIGFTNDWANGFGDAYARGIAKIPGSAFCIGNASGRAAPVTIGAVDGLCFDPDRTPREDHDHPKG